MEKTGKKVVLTKIEPENKEPELETEGSALAAFGALAATGAVFGTALALCRRAMRSNPRRRGN